MCNKPVSYGGVVDAFDEMVKLETAQNNLRLLQARIGEVGQDADKLLRTNNALS